MIHVLDQKTIDKIAAGEVVERPASVVKELLENSIDAGASAITLEITEGGCAMIRVTDNGAGIAPQEVRKAFLRHATSKISSEKDLEAIESLGFRGEALSSIGAVSRCEIITRMTGNLTGTRLVLSGGEEECFEEVGAPEGTTVIVRDLFYNTPARKKFLRSPLTEGAHIGELVQKLALCNETIAFCFISNRQTRFQTGGQGRVRDMIYQLYGKDAARGAISFSASCPFCTMEGYLGAPEVTRNTRSLENIFINRRYIKDSLLSKAVEEGYGDRLMQHQFPFFILHLAMDPQIVDVNVHPRKMEVRFSHKEDIFEAVKGAVEKALAKESAVRRVSLEKEKKSSPSLPPVPEVFEIRRRKEGESILQEEGSPGAFQEAVERIAWEKPRDYDRELTALKQENAPEDLEKERTAQLSFFQRESRPFYRVVGQVFATYWIVELEKELYIMDQHAAHEKVMYEKLLKESRENILTSQTLNPPLVLTLTDRERAALEENALEFQKAGYAWEEFGGREYKINAIPNIFPSVPKEELFKEMLSDTARYHLLTPSQRILAKTASLSCKAAIKGNTPMGQREIEDLLDALLALENPYNCPHGRPTVIRISRAEMEKMFKRIV